MTAAAAGAGIEAARRRARMLALAGIVLAIVASALPPMAQPQSYHGFADQRGWLGIPNFGDVLLGQEVVGRLLRRPGSYLSEPRP